MWLPASLIFTSLWTFVHLRVSLWASFSTFLHISTFTPSPLYGRQRNDCCYYIFLKDIYHQSRSSKEAREKNWGKSECGKYTTVKSTSFVAATMCIYIRMCIYWEEALHLVIFTLHMYYRIDIMETILDFHFPIVLIYLIFQLLSSPFLIKMRRIILY